MRRRTKLTKCDSTCTRVIYSALNRFPHSEFYPTWRAINILRKKQMGENINCNNHMAPGPCGSASGDHRSGGRGQRPEPPIGCSRWSPVPRPATAVSPPRAVGNVADGYEEGQKIAATANTRARLASARFSPWGPCKRTLLSFSFFNFFDAAVFSSSSVCCSSRTDRIISLD